MKHFTPVMCSRQAALGFKDADDESFQVVGDISSYLLILFSNCIYFLELISCKCIWFLS